MAKSVLRSSLRTATRLLTGDLGYAKEQIGKINVNEFSTYVAVDRQIADQAVARLNQGRIKGKSVKVRRVG